jgi:hypothetical protein
MQTKLIHITFASRHNQKRMAQTMGTLLRTSRLTRGVEDRTCTRRRVTLSVVMICVYAIAKAATEDRVFADKSNVGGFSVEKKMHEKDTFEADVVVDMKLVHGDNDW